ncbi:YdeI/OmpD-associated family protein [Draconibacterium mangrovi]|uniref:YdeI/OmpD-associated family protein n=1 Tax=Draconibacterium mangrovi TaxID=2697469 RepID=UPI0013D4C24C|nr:YdeI/OmpD-associated family protein [Draconibacterium mangrovi]
MPQAKTVDEYILNARSRQDILMVLHDLLIATELSGTIKWGAPCYTINGKNVVGLGVFKEHMAIWFFQGALLKDEAKVLINAQNDKTKALRQWRFVTADDIDAEMLIAYVQEAISNEKQNKRVKINRNKKLVIPPELEDALNQDNHLKLSFQEFTPGKQREFADYIAHAKQEKTRQSRLQKIIPMINNNIGLNDKYRNC